MNCATNERKLALLAEGDLSPGREAKLRDHVAECPKCRDRLASIEASQASLKRHARIAIQPSELRGMHDAVMARVAAEPVYGRQRRVAGYAAWSVVCLAAVAGLWVALGNGDMQSSEAGKGVVAQATGSLPAETTPNHVEPVPQVYAEIGIDEPVEMDALPQPKQSKYSRSDVVIKLITDNPDIVIYWLGSSDETDGVQT